MVMIGMIFQFNTEQGTGLIMLSDGEQKTFSTNEWTDKTNSPSVGLEILYQDNDNHIEIKVASEEEKNEIRSTKKPKKEEEITSFTSPEAFQDYFTQKGFDLIKSSDETVDKLSMGKLSDLGVQSVSINFKENPPKLTKSLLPLSNIDEHIQYFKDTGYRVVKDTQEREIRTAVLRRYVMDEHSEISIQDDDNQITLTKMVNGKQVS